MQVYQVLSKLTKKYQYETDQHRHWQGTVMIQSFHVGTKQQQPLQSSCNRGPFRLKEMPYLGPKDLVRNRPLVRLVGFIRNVGNRCPTYETVTVSSYVNVYFFGTM